MKNLNEELAELRKEFGTDAFDEHIGRIKEMYTTPEEKKALVNFVLELADTCESELQNVGKELSLLEQLNEVSNIVSLSYIAKRYFGKSKSWFSQRMHGHLVNGKEAGFTPEEIQTLNMALQDISKTLGSISFTC